MTWLSQFKKIQSQSNVAVDQVTEQLASQVNPVSGVPLIFALTELDSDIEGIMFGMGCFWGAERKLWQTKGVYSTAVGYSGGHADSPDYKSVCSGQTGHAEVVLVLYNKTQISLNELFNVFWESHNPTEGMKQGNDVGTQYRSAIYCYTDEDLALASDSQVRYQKHLELSDVNELITTEIKRAGPFYFAELYHQQYLHKNPEGYCSLRGLDISPIQPEDR